jgi:hypothetical protein
VHVLHASCSLALLQAHASTDAVAQELTAHGRHFLRDFNEVVKLVVCPPQPALYTPQYAQSRQQGLALAKTLQTQLDDSEGGNQPAVYTRAQHQRYLALHVLPSNEELGMRTTTVDGRLPKNQTTAAYRSAHELLSTHVQLMQEDCYRALREGIQQLRSGQQDGVDGVNVYSVQVHTLQISNTASIRGPLHAAGHTPADQLGAQQAPHVRRARGALRRPLREPAPLRHRGRAAS